MRMGDQMYTRGGCRCMHKIANKFHIRHTIRVPHNPKPRLVADGSFGFLVERRSSESVRPGLEGADLRRRRRRTRNTFDNDPCTQHAAVAFRSATANRHADPQLYTTAGGAPPSQGPIVASQCPEAGPRKLLVIHESSISTSVFSRQDDDAYRRRVYSRQRAAAAPPERQ
jgi:hypothetical protein